MAYLFFLVLILAIGGLIFGKADTKKEILNQVGLDLSNSTYENKKETEFVKYCKKAIKIASEECVANNEEEFLRYTYHFLVQKRCDNLYIGIKSHYVDFAIQVLSRRVAAITHKSEDKILGQFNFSNKYSINRYIDILWEKYQYPWPKNWLQRDGM